MGFLQAADLAVQVHRRSMDLETALRRHLGGNIYPPVDVAWVPVIVEALAYLNEPRRRIDVTEVVVSTGDPLDKPIDVFEKDGERHYDMEVQDVISVFFLDTFAAYL